MRIGTDCHVKFLYLGVALFVVRYHGGEASYGLLSVTFFFVGIVGDGAHEDKLIFLCLYHCSLSYVFIMRKI